MKKCARCKIEQEYINFTKRKTTHDKYNAYCKNCGKKAQILYKRTEKGLITQIYNMQKQSSKKRNYSLPNYTKEELSIWLYKNNFKNLYNNWTKSNYSNKLIPSVDRDNDYDVYSLDKISLTTWQQNKQKGHDFRRCGKNNKNSKKINQYDLNMNLIQTYHSQHEAARQTDATQRHISACCRGLIKQHKGFIWKFIN